MSRLLGVPVSDDEVLASGELGASFLSNVRIRTGSLVPLLSFAARLRPCKDKSRLGMQHFSVYLYHSRPQQQCRSSPSHWTRPSALISTRRLAVAVVAL